jgi:hypothetical protein
MGAQVTSWIAAWQQATLAGETYLGATLQPDAGRIWVERRPLEGRRTVLLSRPGALGGNIGLNEDLLGGVAMSIRTADTDDRGLTADVALRLVLEGYALPEEALAAAIGLSYADGAQLLFGRADAGVRGIESSAHLRRELRPDMGTLAGVGLYHDAELSQTQVPIMSPESAARLQAQWNGLEQTLQSNVGWIGVEKALLTLQETAGEPRTLILFRPASQTLWIGGDQAAAPRLLVFQPFGNNGTSGLP